MAGLALVNFEKVEAEIAETLGEISAERESIAESIMVICRICLPIGYGSVGSTVAELLARFGLIKLTLYDFDKVESKNLANQMFRQEHVGMTKVDALAHMLCEINPEIKVTIMVTTRQLHLRINIILIIDSPKATKLY